MHLPTRSRRRLVRPAVLGLALAAFAPLVLAQQRVIEPFPRAEVARERVQDNTEHSVVIGNIRRINNQEIGRASCRERV